jgi:ADP-ribose pyrophosphatase YjhB (NUDIX family)
MEPGESPEQAVIREVLEETSLHTHVACSLGVVTLSREGFRYAIHEHLLVPVDGLCARAGDDASETTWAALGELDALGVTQDVIDVVRHGLAEARSRSLC